MTNTYSGDPRTNDKDTVRFLLGATADPWIFTDEEILFALEGQGNPYNAAAELSLIKAAEYTDRKDKTVGPLSIKYGEIGERWTKLAQALRKRSGRGSGAVAITTQRSTSPYFRLGQHDTPVSLLPDWQENQ